MESCPSGRRCSTRNAVSRKASRVRIPNSPPKSPARKRFSASWLFLLRSKLTASHMIPADRSARMNPAGSQISLHQCSNLHKYVLTCGAIYSKRLVGRFQALTSLGSGRTLLLCVKPDRMTFNYDTIISYYINYLANLTR